MDKRDEVIFEMSAALTAINKRINELAQDAKKPHVRDIQDFQRWSSHALTRAKELMK